MKIELSKEAMDELTAIRNTLDLILDELQKPKRIITESEYDHD